MHAQDDQRHLQQLRPPDAARGGAAQSSAAPEQNLIFSPLDNIPIQPKFLAIPPHSRGVTGTLVARGGMRRLRAGGGFPGRDAISAFTRVFDALWRSPCGALLRRAGIVTDTVLC